MIIINSASWSFRTDNLAKREKANSSADTQDLITCEVSVLESINKKLDLLSLPHPEIKDLRAKLEFSHQQINDM